MCQRLFGGILLLTIQKNPPTLLCSRAPDRFFGGAPEMCG